jgi:hypothetical protein
MLSSYAAETPNAGYPVNAHSCYNN